MYRFKTMAERFKSSNLVVPVLLVGAILALYFTTVQPSFSISGLNPQVPFSRLLPWPKDSSIEGLVSLYVWPRPVTPVGPMTNVSLVSAFCDRGVMTVYKESVPRSDGDCNFIVISTGLHQEASGNDYPTHPIHAEYGWQCLLCTAQPSDSRTPSADGDADISDGVLRWSGVQVNGSDKASWQPQRPTLGTSALVDLTCRRSASAEMDGSWSYNYGWNPAQFQCRLAESAQGSERRPTWAALVMQQDSIEEIEQRLFGGGVERSLARFVAVEDLAPQHKRQVDNLDIGTCLQSPIYNMGSLDKRRQKMLVEWVAYNLYVLRVSRVYIYLNQGDLEQPPTFFLQQIAYMATHWNVTVVEFGHEASSLGYHLNQYEMVADCYYRASGAHDYVAFHDFDEFPTSTGVETTRWTDTLWHELQADDVGVFSFLNINVLGMCPHSGEGINPDLVTASETYSDHEYGSDRPKMLVKAGAVRYCYVHYSRGGDPELRNIYIDPSRLYMRHFTGGQYVHVDDCSSVELEKSNMRRSYILLRFQDILGERLNEVLALGRDMSKR